MSINYLSPWILFPTFLFLLTVLLIVLLVELTKTKKQVNELSRIMYTILTNSTYTDTRTSKIEDGVTQTYAVLESLSSSTINLMKEVSNSRNEKIYPTPQLAEMIGATIQEQIMTEITLRSDMSVPLPGSKAVEDVTNIVCATYPHVNQSYIARRVIAMIENIKRQNNQSSE